MKVKFSLLLFFIVCSYLLSNAQPKAIVISDAGKSGISISELDEIYLSAVHIDTSKAVFKSEAEQQQMFEAYMKLLQDFGRFLDSNDFVWEHQTKGFNRIYFNSDGTIDYFLYSFHYAKPEEQLSRELQSEFNRLLNIFVQSYKIPMTAGRKFAQCSPTTYKASKPRMY